MVGSFWGILPVCQCATRRTLASLRRTASPNRRFAIDEVPGTTWTRRFRVGGFPIPLVWSLKQHRKMQSEALGRETLGKGRWDSTTCLDIKSPSCWHSRQCGDRTGQNPKHQMKALARAPCTINIPSLFSGANGSLSFCGTSMDLVAPFKTNQKEIPTLRRTPHPQQSFLSVWFPFFATTQKGHPTEDPLAQPFHFRGSRLLELVLVELVDVSVVVVGAWRPTEGGGGEQQQQKTSVL